MRTRAFATIACLAIAAGACGTAQSSPTATGASPVTNPPTAAPATTVGPTASSAGPGSTIGPAGTMGLDGWQDPSNFVATIDNPWLPMKPGSVLRYTGTKDGKQAKDITTVTSRTEVVAGVTCTVVDDKLWLNGRLEETTLDYYVQDVAGNVWYF